MSGNLNEASVKFQENQIFPIFFLYISFFFNPSTGYNEYEVWLSLDKCVKAFY